MDEMAQKLREFILISLQVDQEGGTAEDPPVLWEASDWRETEDGLAVKLGDAEYRVRIERA